MARTRRPGMSLMEVILALAIMLMSLVAIARLVDIGLDRSLDARFQTRATLLAESKLADVEAGAIPVQGGSSGSFDADPDWAWHVDSQPSGPPNLYQVTVRVTRTTPGRPFELSLTQLIVDPAVLGSAAQAEDPNAQTDTETTAATGATP